MSWKYLGSIEFWTTVGTLGFLAVEADVDGDVGGSDTGGGIKAGWAAKGGGEGGCGRGKLALGRMPAARRT